MRSKGCIAALAALGLIAGVVVCVTTAAVVDSVEDASDLVEDPHSFFPVHDLTSDHTFVKRDAQRGRFGSTR